MFVNKNCLNCSKIFRAEQRYINRGHAKFCSIKCSSIYSRAHRPKPKPNVKCAFCDKMFYRNATKKKNSRSGIYFCCRQHKDAGQRITSGITEIHPDHYNGGVSVYRDAAFREYEPECDKCGYGKYKSVMVVHHIDHDRDNNDVANLQILCRNCHMEHHLGL